MKKLIFYSLLLPMLSCSGQDTGLNKKILPGDPSVDVTKVSDHYVRYERDGGLMNYELKKVKKDGKDLFQLALHVEMKGQIWPDTILFDANSFGLAGRSLVNRRGGFKAKIAIDKVKLNATVDELPGKSLDWKGDYSHTYPHELFEISVLNYAIKTLPLKAGYKASLPVFMFNLDFTIGWVDVEVVAKEKLKIGSKKYDVWKVNAIGGKIGDKTFWISDELPYALKIESKGLKAWTFAREL